MLDWKLHKNHLFKPPPATSAMTVITTPIKKLLKEKQTQTQVHLCTLTHADVHNLILVQ